MELEYIGLTHDEVALLSAVIYSTLRISVLQGPDDLVFELTDKGRENLNDVAFKLEQVELTP